MNGGTPNRNNDFSPPLSPPSPEKGDSSIDSSSDSPSKYVRPMQRNANGQMVPIVDITNSPRANRPQPPSRDHRSRTPKLSNASSTNTGVLRDGPSLVPMKPTVEEPPNAPREERHTSFLSTDTINSGFGGAARRRRPFDCCHTM